MNYVGQVERSRLGKFPGRGATMHLPNLNATTAAATKQVTL